MSIPLSVEGNFAWPGTCLQWLCGKLTTIKAKCEDIHQQVKRLLAFSQQRLPQHAGLENTKITNKPLAASMRPLQSIAITYSLSLCSFRQKPVLNLLLNTEVESIMLRSVKASQIKTAVNKQRHSLQLLPIISTVALQEIWLVQRAEGGTGDCGDKAAVLNGIHPSGKAL